MFKDALNEGIIERDPTWNAPIYEKKPTKKEEDKFMSLIHHPLEKPTQHLFIFKHISYMHIQIVLHFNFVLNIIPKYQIERDYHVLSEKMVKFNMPFILFILLCVCSY